MSRQRQLIYDIVMTGPAHRTAEEIYDLAREAMPSLARGTVYRNLGLLEREGKIRRLEMHGAPARYDRSPRTHPHLICQRCGRVEDLVMPEGLLEPLAQGVAITGYDVKLYYICPGCGAEKGMTEHE